MTYDLQGPGVEAEKSAQCSRLYQLSQKRKQTTLVLSCLIGGFHGHGGTPIAGWFIIENPIQKWMIWGYPYFRKPPIEYGFMKLLSLLLKK